MNYIKQVAEMLGVELGEEFNIQTRGMVICWKGECWDGESQKFWFDENGLQVDKDPKSYNYIETALSRLIDGTWSIVKKPWKPKEGERFYYVSTNGDICTDVNERSVSDATFIAFGNCFKTKADAEAHKDEIIAKMKEVFD